MLIVYNQQKNFKNDVPQLLSTKDFTIKSGDFGDGFKYLNINYSKVISTQNENKWILTFYFYVNGDYFLPTDFFIIDINTPFGVYENVSIYETTDYESKIIYDNKKPYKKIYKTSISIDINEIEYLLESQGKQIGFDIKFSANPDVLKTSFENISTKDFQNFVNETTDQKIHIDVDFTNIYNSEYYGVFSIPKKEVFDINKRQEYVGYPIILKGKNYTDDPFLNIVELTEIKTNSDKNIRIDNVYLNIIYRYQNKYKNDNINLSNLNINNTTNLSISLENYDVYYDKNEGKMQIKNGNKGMYFGFETNGYYIVEFSLYIDNIKKNFIFKNDFNHLKDNNFYNINCMQTNNLLENFNVVKNY